MNKSGVFLVIFILLLGFAVVPTEPASYATLIEPSSSVDAAAAATTGTLRIQVVDDVSVISASFADMNFDGETQLFLGAVLIGSWQFCRSWFRFDLTLLPNELSVQSATMNVHIENEFDVEDEAIGVYHSTDDTWDSTSITWNNQPVFSSTPSDVIDSPASPDMFQPMRWYSWDVTSDVRSTLTTGDMVLTEVLKQTTEEPTQSAFMYPSRSVTYPFNATYLEIEYTTPTTSDLSVDGISSGPLLEYINNPAPDLGWTFSDSDYNDFQKDYDIELWNNTHYNDTMLWQAAHERISFIHDSGLTGGHLHPFGVANEFRLQMKFPTSELPQSGVVDKLYFTSMDDIFDIRVEDLEISMLMVADTMDLTADLNANYDGRTPTVVLSRDLYELSVTDNTLEIDVEDTFFLNEHLNLIIEIRLTNNTGDLIYLSRTSAGPGSVATNDGDSDGVAATYDMPMTYDLKIGFLTTDVFKGHISADNGFPFDTTAGYSGRFQVKYNQSYINRAGYIDRVFMRGDSSDDIVFDNFSVTIVETPMLGPITNGTWVNNYGGATPTVVLDESMYIVRNVGQCIVIDFDNTFYYSNNFDLLLDIQWDSLVSGAFRILENVPYTSSYRAWDLHYAGDFREDSDVAGYDLLIDFVNNEDSVPLEGCITLTDGTWYYLRARTCDSFGVWGDWTTLQFKYEVVSEIPGYSDPISTPVPAIEGEDVTVSINVTHSLGIYEVLFELNGLNYSMTAVGDTYSNTWAPATTGLLNYTIYMRSNGDSWASVDGSVLVQTAATGPSDMTLILVIGAVAVVIVVIIVVVLKKKPAKK